MLRHPGQQSPRLELWRALPLPAPAPHDVQRQGDASQNEERELLHLRIELDFDYEEIAGMTGRASRDAARMAVRRALTRLAKEMGDDA